jgi:hypothetical protein
MSGVAMESFAFINRFNPDEFLRSAGGRSWQATVQSDGADDASYFTIEGMRGQEFSVGIFIFMLIGVLVFAAIILRFLWMARKESELKTGEKIMFIWIIIGTIVAVIFGGLQLLQGRLF